jgi:DNA-directed RNA polymerase specialized sigma24 family protein
MPRAVRRGNNGRRVDKHHDELTKRSAQTSDGEEVWIEPEPMFGPAPEAFISKRRSSRDVNPERVQQAFLLAFIYLMDQEDFSPTEIGKVFGMSRAKVYRQMQDIRTIREQGPEAFFDDEGDDE